MLAAAVTSAKLGALLDYILSVDTVRIYKPSPEVYKLAPNAFGVEPGQIAFVSANSWDCAGAAAFGFRVIHVNRFKQAEERLDAHPRCMCRSLAEAQFQNLTLRLARVKSREGNNTSPHRAWPTPHPVLLLQGEKEQRCT